MVEAAQQISEEEDDEDDDFGANESRSEYSGVATQPI